MLRGSKSRNKVSVGEPAEGSLPHFVELSAVLRRVSRYPPHVNIEMFDAFINFLTPVNKQLIVDWVSGRAAALLSGCVAEAQQHTNPTKTPNDGYLGSRNDEERSEMRYAVRIAEFSESSEL